MTVLKGLPDVAPGPRPGVDWDKLGFGLTTKETQMVVARCKLGGEWSSFEVQPYGPLELEPAATALNYGQSIFEGMKAFRTTKGRIVVFRPEMNALRLKDGAERFLIPPVPGELFLEMCGACVKANADWVPPAGKGDLYIRPLLFGSGAALGVSPSPEYTFVFYVAPVGRYFSGGARLKIETDHQRAACRGVGNTKAAGNYAPCFQAQAQARAAGFSDVVYLDAVDGRHIEEAAASNMFVLGKDGVLRTPRLGTILPGVTRDTVLALARHLVDITSRKELKAVEESDVTVDMAMEAAEVFVTGTGAGITSVVHLALDSRAVDLPSSGSVADLIQATLQEIRMETETDRFGWLWDPFTEAPADRLAKR